MKIQHTKECMIPLFLPLKSFDPKKFFLELNKDTVLNNIYVAEQNNTLNLFANDKHINFLQQKNKVLENQKYNYPGILNKTFYLFSAFVASGSILGLGVGSLFKSIQFFILENNTLGIILLGSGILLIYQGAKALLYVQNCDNKITHDLTINFVIKQNETIITQLKELKKDH